MRRADEMRAVFARFERLCGMLMRIMHFSG